MDTSLNTEMPEDTQATEPAALQLMALIGHENIAADLPDEELGPIGQRVVKDYETDETSRSEWLADMQDALELAKQTKTEKSYPWPGAANVKFPLLTTASIQFAARAYPSILANGEVVKANPVGYDPAGAKAQRAERISRHMSWQLLEEMPDHGIDWESETDLLLHMLPIVGTVFRKTYHQDVCRSELVSAEDLVVNMGATSLEAAPRVTQIVRLYPHEIEERIRAGVFREDDYNVKVDDDEDAPQEFLEQHRRWDMDDDGYAEPYICTVHKETGKVARIVARYTPEQVEVDQAGNVLKISGLQYFTQYSFLPNPDGSIYAIGFGHLLRPINEAINTSLNQLIDAGHLSNTQGGFIGSGMRLRKGDSFRFLPGEWKPVNIPGDDIRKSMVPLQFAPPSPVLFQLLGLLVESGKEIASVSESMVGESTPGQAAAATMALIEQGMRVFSSIYKRIHRSLKSEFRKIYELNRIYLDPNQYAGVLDNQAAVSQQDYGPDMDVVPVSDPQVVSEIQRVARAEALLPLSQDPMMNGMEIKKYYLEQLGIEEPERFLAQPPPPDPMQQKMQAIQLATSEANLAYLRSQTLETLAKIRRLKTQSIKDIAEAEAEEEGIQLDQYMAQLNAIEKQVNAAKAVYDAGADYAGRMAEAQVQPGVQSPQSAPSVPPEVVARAVGLGGAGEF